MKLGRFKSRVVDSKICKNCHYDLEDHMAHMFENCRSCPVDDRKNVWYVGVNYVPWHMTNLEYLEYKYNESNKSI